MARTPTHPVAAIFFRGLALILPLVLTAALLVWVWNLLADNVVGQVDAAVLWIVERLVEVTGDETDPQRIAALADEVLPPGLRLALSIVATLVLILFLGWWLSGFIGRRVFRGFEKLIGKVPLVGAIYPYARQITDFFFGQKKRVEFERVVAIPYPRLDVYSLAFLTGSSLRSLNEAVGGELISVFVPSSPMPATGYTLFVPADQIVVVRLTVEEALRVVISGGVLVPEKELGPQAEAPGLEPGRTLSPAGGDGPEGGAVQGPGGGPGR